MMLLDVLAVVVVAAIYAVILYLWHRQDPANKYEWWNEEYDSPN